MPSKIIVVDFAGTLVKPEIIEEANVFRSKILQRSLPSKKEHGKSELLYKNNRQFVEKLTGLKRGMTVVYRANDGHIVNVDAEKYQNQISTNLFQIGMYMVARKHGRKIFYNGICEALSKIKRKGYKLAIVSGVRTDIISGMLQIAHCSVTFDYILGQPPILGLSNEDLLKELRAKGNVLYVIGDKASDLEAAKKLKAKAIFAMWGHPTGGEEKIADFAVRNANQLLKVIK